MWELWNWICGWVSPRSADIVGNRSVHYTTRRILGRHKGVDQIPLDTVGCKPYLTPGHFRVYLRYPTRAAAEAAGQSVVEMYDGIYVRAFDVPVIAREHPSENVPSEIHVEW